MKIAMVFLSIIFGSLAESPLFNKYWLPPGIRTYFVAQAFEPGQCLKHDSWAVNPKKVVGYSEKKRGYILMDMDRHEHLQVISQAPVEREASVTNCPFH